MERYLLESEMKTEVLTQAESLFYNLSWKIPKIISHSVFLILFSSRGEADVSYTIPDSITEWKASAFCVQDDAGFGISSPVSMTAFQPFFVDLTLPYSVTRGEKFNLIANVFNYLDKCVQVYQVPFYFLWGLLISQGSFCSWRRNLSRGCGYCAVQNTINTNAAASFALQPDFKVILFHL